MKSLVLQFRTFKQIVQCTTENIWLEAFTTTECNEISGDRTYKNGAAVSFFGHSHGSQ
jgi:hypothetical protein